MIEDPTAPDASTTAASDATQALDEPWSDWVASPDDPAAQAALVDAVSDAVAADVSEALDDAAADLADGSTDGSADGTTDATLADPATQDALTAADPDAAQDASAQIMHEEMTYGADDVLSDQLSALGSAENFNDGMMTSDGTRDYDWT